MPSLSLLLGIKRRKFREDDPRALRADAEFKARRSGALQRHRYTCAGCGYVAQASLSAQAARTAQGGPGSLDVHHLDDDHHNNDDENLVPGCHACHPYQHVGEVVRRTDIPGEGLGKKTLIAAIPEIEARDLNLLQRAMGAALLDDNEAPIARQILEHLAERATWVKAEFGTFRPADFAAAFAALKPDEYAARGEAIEDLRLLFSEEVLKTFGNEFRADYQAVPVASWDAVARGARRKPDAPDNGGD